MEYLEDEENIFGRRAIAGRRNGPMMDYKQTQRRKVACEDAIC
jgi:hypothetical protein